MSLKVRTFNVSKLNKCLDIIVIIAISAVLVSMRLSYGQEYNITAKASWGIPKDKAEKIVLLIKGKMEQILTNVKEEIRAQSKEEGISIADELSKLAKLREQGVLSDSEFQKLKQKLL